ncbi:triose-phosphate isomerase [Paracoccus sediminilitoris]|uniref:triose-phosphate isomerase n=1 Tax=Paracoccus sediminilitoris TaxID=2202419 RepID=UPI0027297F5B|nr:triose-phosphate isomerase [Paracoccus sediminilitoris]
MAPRKIAAGNWKMNGDLAALAQLDALAGSVDGNCQVVICPPALLIHPMSSKSLPGIQVGGQDCHAKASGAHTGDLAAAQLRDAGATHVILGHSERRADHAETDANVSAKAVAAHQAGLVTIICVGETEGQRDGGDTLQVISQQLAGSVPDCATAENTVIAYEPVWAIGTGRTPTDDQIAEVHARIRADLSERFANGADMALLYGGSVKAGNAVQIFAITDVNGALVGGASLKAEDFAPIVAALAAA